MSETKRIRYMDENWGEPWDEAKRQREVTRFSMQSRRVPEPKKSRTFLEKIKKRAGL